MENHQWKRVYISLILAGIFFILMVYAMTGMDCMSGGCAVAFASLFLLQSGYFTGIYGNRPL